MGRRRERRRMIIEGAIVAGLIVLAAARRAQAGPGADETASPPILIGVDALGVSPEGFASGSTTALAAAQRARSAESHFAAAASTQSAIETLGTVGGLTVTAVTAAASSTAVTAAITSAAAAAAVVALPAILIVAAASIVAMFIAAAQNDTSFGWAANACEEGIDPATGIDWLEFGLPYRPDAGRLDPNAGVFLLPVPGGPSLVNDQGQPLVYEDTVNMTVSIESLRQLFPGDGALEACAASGMFAWRPGDVPTPFSDVIEAGLPYLRDYDRFARIAWDIRSDGLAGIELLGSPRPGDDIAEAKRIVRWVRALAALRDSQKVTNLTRADLAYPDPDYDYPNPLATDTSVGTHMVNRIAWPGGSPAQRAGELSRLWCAVGMRALAFSPTGSHRDGDTVNLGHPGNAHFNPPRCGFPGAWRLTSAAPTLPARTTTHAWREMKPDYISVGNITQNLNGFGPAGYYVSREIMLPPADALTLEQWGPRIEVWTPTGSKVVALAIFADLFGSIAAAANALTLGSLAWHPKHQHTYPCDPSPAGRALERWEVLDPSTLGMRDRFKDWEPFNVL